MTPFDDALHYYLLIKPIIVIVVITSGGISSNINGSLTCTYMGANSN